MGVPWVAMVVVADAFWLDGWLQVEAGLSLAIYPIFFGQIGQILYKICEIYFSDMTLESGGIIPKYDMVQNNSRNLQNIYYWLKGQNLLKIPYFSQ